MERIVLKTSNDMAINLAHSEFKSLRAFFSLYLALALLLLTFIAYFYFQYQKNTMLFQWRLQLQLQGESFLPKLKAKHFNFDVNQSYPRESEFHTAIYDIDRNRIFSTLRTATVNLNEVISLNNGYIQFIMQPEAYYLGAKYIVLEVKDDEVWLEETWDTIITAFILTLLLLIFSGWYLSKLFLRPMRQAVSLLDKFIKDTTHELNTPVSTILSNIEVIDKESLDENTRKKLQRIDIASRTISTLYDDLTFLVLHHNLSSKDELLNLSLIIIERLDYFSLSIKQKQLRLELDISRNVNFYADETKMHRLFDNLISNAIKYNTLQGELKITLHDNLFIIENSGKGISKEKLPEVFNRFIRDDTVVGGFGIGLHIVSKIAKHYKINTLIDSKPHEFTRVVLTW